MSSAATMPAQHGHSEGCCNTPPVIADGYGAKGTYEQVGGLKTYVTGPASAERGIIFICDIFGFSPQTVQGADRMAAGDSHRSYRVLVPDLFDGQPCPIEVYPPTDDDKKRRLGEFFQKHAPAPTAERVAAFTAAAQAQYPGLAWGIVGHCWGGKVTCLVVKKIPTAFRAIAVCHPAMVDAADAAAIPIPMCLLASKDEDSTAVAAFADALPGHKHVETFSDQIHGWMGARADLASERVRDEYTRGYKTVMEFIGRHL